MTKVLLALSLSLAIASALPAQDQPPKGLARVAPLETEEILANPSMGWETFHRTSKQDKALPSWIPSTVHYARWGWGELETRPGQLNTEFLDKVLRQTHESGQTLAFRVMCCSTSVGHPYHPRWLTEVGGKELQADYAGHGPLPIPDMDDPEVLDRHLDFIRRLGQRYDGHPDIAHVDLGSIGWWGEWHLSGSKKCKLPTLENRKKVIDAYLAAFKRTPLLMLIGGGECLKYAAERGCGWRADCLGDMGGFSKRWCHMRKGYPVWIKQAGIHDVWKTSPVAWETCWDMRKWVDEGWSLRFIFNYALACHASCINNKSAPLPPGENVQPELERFLRRLGYRLVLKELTYPLQARPGGTLPLSMKWQNQGSAPCYRPYRVACRLAGTDGKKKVFVTKIAVDRWLPGSIDLFSEEFFQEPKDLPPGEVVSVSETISLPGDLPAGEYTLSVAVVDEKTSLPAIRLGIQGRADDGWYPLGKLTLSR